MPRRKELKGIAFGIASSFSSRNNDVDGYWALGLLYKLAAEAGSSCFSLNMKSGQSTPAFRFSRRIMEPYATFLGDQLKKKGFEWCHVESAIIVLDFNVSPTKRQVMFKSTWGEPFACRVHLTDDLNRVWSSEIRGWCGIHDPLKEHRSTRRYAS